MALHITLPLPPNIANARWHWHKRRRLEGNYWLRCTAAHPERPPEPIAPAVVHVKAFVGNLNDEDNLVARLKWAIDWMVDRDILLDDHPSAMTLGTVEQAIDRKRKRLEITVMETDE